LEKQETKKALAMAWEICFFKKNLKKKQFSASYNRVGSGFHWWVSPPSGVRLGGGGGS